MYVCQPEHFFDKIKRVCIISVKILHYACIDVSSEGVWSFWFPKHFGPWSLWVLVLANM